ncbi:MAG: DegT/DnrJ/EryC1/StrS family aminotransferase [Bacteroidales bacterium]|nr:DegT/DnrJ/EryC1/StrS family aminotransferase [Bacteroidales bacterium]
MEHKQITVTSPLLPDLNEFQDMLQDIWNRKWITNNGHYHQQLEQALADYLKVPYISLFTNGTLPLITALQALKVQGEVITTPYSFVATTHSIWWNGLTPVFVDVDANTGNIDPDAIEAAITPRTTAIMPVHVYGQPCDVERIDAIAKKYDLKVIYDAAHAFGVETNGNSILEWGDMCTLSFHATKVYNTIEGGALVCRSEEMKYEIDNLKNFGFRGETNVVAPGINSKMDEMRAAYGLLNLKQVDNAIVARKRVAEQYVKALTGVKGIRLFPCEIRADFRWNYAYFPILVTEDYGMTRDELYAKMKEQDIFGRRYFYPLISAFSPYNKYSSANERNLPNAVQLADSVICLPMHHAMSEIDVKRVLDCLI